MSNPISLRVIPLSWFLICTILACVPPNTAQTENTDTSPSGAAWETLLYAPQWRDGAQLARIRVDGGWLYAISASNRVAMEFVPDPYAGTSCGCSSR